MRHDRRTRPGSRFKDPKALRGRWEEDSWLGATNGRLAVARAGSFAGDVSYKDRSPAGCQGAIYEIGIALFPGTGATVWGRPLSGC